MRILAIHADYIEFAAKKKAFPQAEENISKEKERIEECLVIFTAVEKPDEQNFADTLGRYVQEIKNIAQQVSTTNIVLYPYAHLSSNLSSPQAAEKLMKEAEGILSQRYRVSRAPFGWYKAFTISCKGHPLSELSREFNVKGDAVNSEPKSGQIKTKLGENKTEVKELTPVEMKQLLKTASRSRLDTSKLKDNDHRIIGQNLDLWSFNEIAPGMVFWHDKGLIIKNLLIEYWRKIHRDSGYLEISTPQIMDKKLWMLSGHWGKYHDQMFVSDYEQRDFAVKPMNCPGGILVYKTSSKSYKDLPLRVGEMGLVHRKELSGVLAGLFRLIQFTQDDAHIFCTEEQIESEVGRIIDIIQKVYSTFNLEFDHIELSTRPENRIGREEIWDLSEQALENVLKKRKVNYKINTGDGAFYGPKIDFHLKDSLGRTWQCSTIQLDMSQPERFDLEYADKDGTSKRPIMLHRVVYGAIERFMGILVEHLNGKLPLWLSPIQVKILTINDQAVSFAQKVAEILKEKDIRVEIDDRTETLGKKVREAQLEKVNYIVTIGNKEVDNSTLAVRTRSGEQRFGVKAEEFIDSLVEEVRARRI